MPAHGAAGPVRQVADLGATALGPVQVLPDCAAVDVHGSPAAQRITCRPRTRR
jgi:hypothetical protein